MHIIITNKYLLHLVSYKAVYRLYAVVARGNVCCFASRGSRAQSIHGLREPLKRLSGDVLQAVTVDNVTQRTSQTRQNMPTGYAQKNTLFLLIWNFVLTMDQYPIQGIQPNDLNSHSFKIHYKSEQVSSLFQENWRRRKLSLARVN
jgi:hypothetical protein